MKFHLELLDSVGAIPSSMCQDTHHVLKKRPFIHLTFQYANHQISHLDKNSKVSEQLLGQEVFVQLLCRRSQPVLIMNAVPNVVLQGRRTRYQDQQQMNQLYLQLPKRRSVAACSCTEARHRIPPATRGHAPTHAPAHVQL